METFYPDDNFVKNMGKIDKLIEDQRNDSHGSHLTIYSGHDTVIAPVLAALGVYNKFCSWPPYASRVVFELWKNNRKLSRSRTGMESIRDYYVRVLYNGNDVTKFIPTCISNLQKVRVEEQKARFPILNKNRASEIRRETDEVNDALHSSFVKQQKYMDPNFEKYHDSEHLCSLLAFSSQIDNIIGRQKSMTEACGGI